MIKIPDRDNLGKERFLCLMVSKAPIHGHLDSDSCVWLEEHGSGNI